MIYYVDERMGVGKSVGLMNYVNTRTSGEKFIFAVTRLSEVDRVIDYCGVKNFCAPFKNGSKLRNIKTLLRDGRNIATTHQLFGRLDDEALRYVRENGYTLIMDEVTEVISPIKVDPPDAAMLIDKYVSVGEDGALTWTYEGYSGKFLDIKETMCNYECYAYNKTHWIKLIPDKLFKAFKDVYILTYLFHDSLHRCYFDMKGFKYERRYISGDTPDTFMLSDKPYDRASANFKSLVHIVDNRKMNAVGNDSNALSKNWYRKNGSCNTPSEMMDQLRKNTYNFFHNMVPCADAYLWTTFLEDEKHIDWRKMLAGRGYASRFLECTAKGVNDYKSANALAYLINVYPNSGVEQFIRKRGVKIDRKKYALSEMIQWIWRSAIRDGKEIWIYIPSRRMRELLIGWLDQISS